MEQDDKKTKFLRAAGDLDLTDIKEETAKLNKEKDFKGIESFAPEDLDAFINDPVPSAPDLSDLVRIAGDLDIPLDESHEQN